jgi:hypothetical protein
MSSKSRRRREFQIRELNLENLFKQKKRNDFAGVWFFFFFVYFCLFDSFVCYPRRRVCLMGTRTKKMVSIISHTRDTELFKKKEKKRRKKLLKQVATMTKLECNSSQNISDCTRRVNNKRKEKKR